MADLENQKISLKTAVIITVSLLTWFGSLCAVYFPMKSNVDAANNTANSCKVRLDNFNPDIVVYRINELDKKVQLNNDKADRIIDMLTKH